MKISKKPTKYILIKAQVKSEWDNCNAALLILEEKFNVLNWIKKCFDAIKELSKLNSFYNASFWYSVDYLSLDELDSKIEKAFEKTGWCYVTLEDKELDSLSKPEQQVDGQTIEIHAGGGFNFKGFAKHTGEEFWTDSINIDKLIKLTK